MADDDKKKSTTTHMHWMVFILGLLMWYTCPEKEKHQQAVQEKIKEVLAAQEDAAAVSGFLSLMTGQDVGELAGKFIQLEDYQKWILFSTAKVKDVRTIGILGNVFFVGKDDKGKGNTSAKSGTNGNSYSKTDKTGNSKYKHLYTNLKNDGYYHVHTSGTGKINNKKIDVDLYVRFRNQDKFQVFIDYGINIFLQNPVSSAYRYGGEDNEWIYETWIRSDDGHSVFYNGNEVDLIDNMSEHSQFEVWVKTVDGNECSASFEGVGEKVQEFIDYDIEFLLEKYAPRCRTKHSF